MTIEALIFDVDGTLADTEEAHRQAFNAAFVEHGLWWNWGSHRYGELLGISGGKERMLAFIETLDVDKDERKRLKGLVPELHRTKTRVFTELVSSGRVPLRPGVARLIQEARDASLRLAISSTTSPENVEALLSTMLDPDAVSWFQVVACGDQAVPKKPAPDIYRLTLENLGVPAPLCVAFEDSDKGVRAAKAADLYTVVTPTLWTATDDFTGADLVLPSLGDPDDPLDADAAARVGGPYLTLERLEALHAAASG